MTHKCDCGHTIEYQESDVKSHYLMCGDPTQKPIKILADIIREYTDEGDIVIDLMGESGSTLIACEQTNRTCYMAELDCKYTDVIRKRYAKFIKKEDQWQELSPVIDHVEINDTVDTPTNQTAGVPAEQEQETPGQPTE